MQAIERGGYSREEILDVLHAKNNSRNVRFRYDLLDKAGKFKETLDCVLSGEVEQSAFSTIKRTAKFKIREDVIPAWEEDREATHTDVRTDGEDFIGGEHNGTIGGTGVVRFAESPLNYAPNGNFDLGTSKTTPAEDVGVATEWSSYGNPVGTQNRASYTLTSVAGQSIDGFAQTMTRKNTGTIGIQTTSKTVLSGLTPSTDVWVSFLFKPQPSGQQEPNFVYLAWSDGSIQPFDFAGATIEILSNGWWRWTGKTVPLKSGSAGVIIAWQDFASTSGQTVIENVHLGKIVRPLWEAEWVSPVYAIGEEGTGKIKSTLVTFDYRVQQSATVKVYSKYSLDNGSTWSVEKLQLSGFDLGVPADANVLGKLMVQYRVVFERFTSLISTNYFDEVVTVVTKHYLGSYPETTKINYLQDRIKPYMEVKMPDGKWISFPLGVFLLSTPTRYDGANGVIYRDIEAYDGLLMLDEDKFTSRYMIPAGTKYTDAVKAIIRSVGIGDVYGTIQYTIEESSKTLTASKEFSIGTSKLEAINELLTAINYTPLWADSNGYFQAFPYVSPADRSIDYTYVDDELSVTYNGMEEELDLNAVPNIWSAVETNPDKPTPLFTRLTNADPKSPTSTVNLGRRIVDFREVEEMADQATLNSYVRRIAFEASQVFGKLKFKTALMPFHEYSDIICVQYSALKVNDKFSETNWKMTLKAGAEMEHEARRVVTLNVS